MMNECVTVLEYYILLMKEHQKLNVTLLDALESNEILKDLLAIQKDHIEILERARLK